MFVYVWCAHIFQWKLNKLSIRNMIFFLKEIVPRLRMSFLIENVLPSYKATVLHANDPVFNYTIGYQKILF